MKKTSFSAEIFSYQNAINMEFGAYNAKVSVLMSQTFSIQTRVSSLQMKFKTQLARRAIFVVPLLVAITSVPQSVNAQSSRPVCSSASSDSDGDGFGFENNRTCIVDTSSGSASSSNNSGSSRFPACASSQSDPDGDGFGFENGRTCSVTSSSSNSSGSNNSSAASSSRFPACASSQSDPDGDGFGFENGRTCQVTSASSSDSGGSSSANNNSGSNGAGGTDSRNTSAPPPPPPVALAATGSVNGRPICLTDASDVNNSGFGFENNQTCVVQPGATATRDNPLFNRRVCEDWFEIPYGNFRLQNNVWNASAVFSNRWSQCITLSGNRSQPVARWDYNWLNPSEGNEFSVKSYPQVYYGRKTRFNQSGTVAETGLPAPLNSVPRFTIDFAFSETGNAERNVAFESFFHYSREAEDANKQFEMMVWVGKPEIRTPGPQVATARIDGRDWDVFVNPALDWGYVAFVAQNPFSSGRLDWSAFIDWTRNNGPAFGVPRIVDSTWMGAIELGTETFWGTGTFSLDRLNITRR